MTIKQEVKKASGKLSLEELEFMVFQKYRKQNKKVSRDDIQAEAVELFKMQHKVE